MPPTMESETVHHMGDNSDQESPNRIYLPDVFIIVKFNPEWIDDPIQGMLLFSRKLNDMIRMIVNQEIFGVVQRCAWEFIYKVIARFICR